MTTVATPGTATAATTTHAPYGTHDLVDCEGVDAALLADRDALRAILRRAAEAAGARILFDHFHDFGHATAGPGGVTGVVVLAESHASIHTWPAAGFAAIDWFLCGDTDADAALRVIEAAFAPAEVVVRRQARGR